MRAVYRSVCAVLLVMFLIRSVDFFWFDVRQFAFVKRGSILGVTTYLTLTADSSRNVLILATLFAVFKGLDESREIPSLGPCIDGQGSKRPCVVMITGANSGIGFGTSQALYEQGHTVVLGCRRSESCSDAAEKIRRSVSATPSKGNKVIPMGDLDLGSIPKVRRWVSKYSRLSMPHVDILINNAGLTPKGKHLLPIQTFLGTDGNSNLGFNSAWETGIAVMQFGHHALTRLLIEEAILDPEDSKLIMVSSDAMYFGRFHSSLVRADDGMGDFSGEETIGCPDTMLGAVLPICFPPFVDSDGESNYGSYARAKLANVLEAKSWNRHTGMHAASVMPGMVYTKMAIRSAPNLQGLSMTIQDTFMRILLRSPRASAAIVLSALHESAEKGMFVNGQGQVMPDRLLPPQASDRAVADALWDLSERLLQSVQIS